MSVKKNGGDSDIAKRRKEQVLEAAVECFKLQGFHKTSMSQISAAAGMSSGHIYHYFGSKEGIVEAIVARDRSQIETYISNVKSSMKTKNAVEALVDATLADEQRFLDRGTAALKMEISAEVSRNASIAHLIQEYDKDVFQDFYNILGGASEDVISKCEIITSLLEGMAVRSVRNPAFGEALDRDMLRKVITFVLSET
ncbi:TetR/AcrR family transcriptional regulator [Erwinia sp. S63]|uniref:TetR/AcrR family transcriptional regulator n=1 Tax=Mixta theicola TaxID=1458355 RepID=A0A2K1Q506_9GAMM|nr:MULTISPECIES: TetR/AcrR family transcriptional regulator [Enterobacterales]HDK6273461.1 TetR/AcrR family transcriptional regulator [Klebsiella quasipneumoniae]HDS5277113.1 TetR/AcrR family transcriptional regulator [Enterobacter hormaechei subsp. steigerwaltii]HDS9535846.1 TetR/AcrR family transcriptional regulator [Klebsiella pneumoniae subsp. pneumoniae]EIV3863196.1 TetR/AcrR family transcriptional regulator [Klebsiella pneumoniae]EJD6546890.1 TetR/AcrR family transcriptional regulator [K